MVSLATRIGRLDLKNPIIAAPAEHMIAGPGLEAAIRAGAGVVVTKSTNESEAAKDQLKRAEYALLGPDWTPLPWRADAPAGVTFLTRSGLPDQSWQEWLDQALSADQLARQHDCLLVPSVILAGEERLVEMAREIAAAGFRAVEVNIGTPYASQAGKGVVATELRPERVAEIVRMVTRAVDIPVWIKLTGQSERVADLAAAAFGAGAESTVMAGRSLGMLPDLETQEPLLGTSCGIGGGWNLPLTCHWLATTRKQIGPEPSLIGINGVTSGLDAARILLAGGSAAAIASEVMLRGFDVIARAVEDLQGYCHAKGTDAAALIGRAADARRSFAQMPLLDNHWQKFVPQLPGTDDTERTDR